jgi:hypothetical protein
MEICEPLADQQRKQEMKKDPKLTSGLSSN